ncbi:unnamed protein product [Bemisia tabaci]|uniref:CCHC-type domain-containing protein n=1 Tax=Bemisia tabaci TaxID=7038 RepID=A0A9P0A8X3_BEMTA|nr:unnamed protein product [Bemisia tabaci]
MVVKSKKATRGEKIVKEIQETAEPIRGNLKVKKMVPIKDGAYMEFKAEGLDQVKLLEELEKKGLEVREPLPSNTLIRIGRVDTQTTAEEMYNDLMNRCLKAKGYTEKIMKAEAKILREISGKFSRSIIMTVTPRMRKHILEEEYVYIGWRRCPVEDYAEVTHCYRCGESGHQAATCSNKEVCFNCGSKRHIARECNREQRCITCYRENPEVKKKHTHLSNKCPI